MTKILSTERPQLHVFHNDVDWVIAPDVAAARQLWIAFNGMPPISDSYDEEQLAFELCPDDSVLRFQDEDGEFGGGLVVKTCRQWADTVPMGCFCTSEW
jgi:hypothetical protein